MLAQTEATRIVREQDEQFRRRVLLGRFEAVQCGRATGYMTYEDIILEKQRGGVALLTLNRPQRLNALRWQSWSCAEPLVGLRRPKRILISVLLPAPFAPTSPLMPGLSSRSSESSAVTLE